MRAADRPADREDELVLRDANGRRTVTPPVRDRPVPGHGELILIVEDEPEFADLLELWVTRHGWRTAKARDGHEAMQRFDRARPDLVLLDLNIPGVDGWQLIDWIRSMSRVPVLVVTALGSEADTVRGLVAGADDYITKPVSFPELVARIQAALRRAAAHADAREDGAIELGPLRIEPRAHRVLVDDVEVHLTPTEFRLLSVLAERPGELLGHRDLLRAVWGPTYGEELQLLRVAMRNLRAKLGCVEGGRGLIETEYGLGYRFRAD